MNKGITEENDDLIQIDINAHSSKQRNKRKNINRALQLLCLQKYAGYVKGKNRLPDRKTSKELLCEAHEDFLKQGGPPTEGCLSFEDFHKLIRNRRREFQQGTLKTKEGKPLTAAKRRLYEERAKIKGLIDAIDAARGFQALPPMQARRVVKRTRTDTFKPSQLLIPPQKQLESLIEVSRETLNTQKEILRLLKSIQGISNGESNDVSEEGAVV